MDFIYLLPELFLTLILVFLLISEVTSTGESNRLTVPITLMGFLGTGVVSFMLYQNDPKLIFHDLLGLDGPALFFKLLFLLVGALAIFVRRTEENRGQIATDELIFIVSGVLGFSIGVESNHLILTFISLQLINVAFFFLIGSKWSSSKAVKAATQFYFFQLFSTFLFLLTCAVLWSKTNTLYLSDIQSLLNEQQLSRDTYLLLFGLSYFSMSFYLFSFPLYLWWIDVFEGVSFSTGLLMGVAFPALGFCLAIRFIIGIFSSLFFGDVTVPLVTGVQWSDLFGMAAGATMLIAAFLSLYQKSVKRIFGLLVMVQTGWIMIPMMNLNQQDISAALIQFFNDAVSLAGMFILLNPILNRNGSDQLGKLRGGFSGRVIEGVLFVCFGVAFLGLPPFSGFISNFILLGSMVQAEQYILASVAVFSRVIQILILTQLIFVLVGAKPAAADHRQIDFVFSDRLLCLVLLLPIFLISVFAQNILDWSSQSVRFILW